MSRKSILAHILASVIITLLMIAAIGYAVVFNDSRLVTPTDFSTYRFIPQDLPLIASVLLVTAFFLYLGVRLVLFVFSRKQQSVNYTRTINPKLGLLGLLGFLGFLGIWTYQMDGMVFPFFFFSFFGFFGFFYEGKLSNLLIDERFRQNSEKAQLQALKTGFILLFIAVFVGGGRIFGGNPEYCAIFLAIALGISFGLVIFLSEYLLYRYDQLEAVEDEE